MRVKVPSTIYAIRCKKNGKMYIGRSADVETRIRTHFMELKSGRKRGSFQSDYDAYGKEAFENYVLERNVPHEVSGDRELFWIEEYKTTDEQFGYNRSVKTGTPMDVRFQKGMPPKHEALYELLTDENKDKVNQAICRMLAQQKLDDLEV